MAIQYRRLTAGELDAFIEMRISQLREEGARRESDLKPALRDYYERHMADGTFVSWLAVERNEPSHALPDKMIGTSGMSFVERPPHFGCPNGRMGILSSMYTDRAYRRQGIASALTSRLALEILRRGKVPFYCAAWSNLRSVRNAIASGFRPAWVELTAKSIAAVEEMNGMNS